MNEKISTRLPSPDRLPVLIATVLLFLSLSYGQKPSGFGGEVVEQKAVTQIGILVEYYQVDHRTANKLIREHSPKAADAQELKNALVEMGKAGTAELIDTSWLRCLSGQRGKTESVREDIYPTEFDPPEIPNYYGSVAPVTTKEKKEQQKANEQAKKIQELAGPVNPIVLMTSATPTAFETQNLGLTLEVDPVLSKEKDSIDIAIAPQIVSRVGTDYYTRPGYEDKAKGIEHVSMPSFYSMQLTTQIKATPGKYNLLGLHTPHGDKTKRILCLLKTDLFQAK